MKLEDIISKFNTTPVLFIGSGMSRKYLSLPDWKGLLEHFARVIKDDIFTYSAYESNAKVLECKAGIMPKIAELIQKDFDLKWFTDPMIRTVNDEALVQIKNNGLSPFKAEIAAFIKRSTIIDPNYLEEINKLAQISEKSIAGVITTN